jgi:surface antigen
MPRKVVCAGRRSAMRVIAGVAGVATAPGMCCVGWSCGRILSLALLGGITLSPVTGDSAHATQTAPTSTTQSWLSINGPWLCRTWSGTQAVVTGLSATATQGQTWQTGTGWFGLSDPSIGMTIHCTLRWQVSSDGQVTSEMPGWVPDPTGELPPDTAADAGFPLSHQKPVVARKTLVRPKTTAKKTTPMKTSAPAANPGAHDPWAAVPGHPSYGMADFKGDPYSGFFGVCTWYAWYTHQSEPLMQLGNAGSWAANAPSHGLRVGSSPVVGATAVFQPGVEGAGGGGHAGHVEEVLGGGWFVISEMNFSWNGGGWGRVDWRFVYVRSGVSFIY